MARTAKLIRRLLGLDVEALHQEMATLRESMDKHQLDVIAQTLRTKRHEEQAEAILKEIHAHMAVIKQIREEHAQPVAAPLAPPLRRPTTLPKPKTIEGVYLK